MIKAVIFDLDGTLIDSAIVILGIINKIRAERGHPNATMDEVRPHLSKGGRALVANSLGKAQLHSDEDLTLFRQYYAECAQDKSIVYEGVFEVLRGLREMGVRLGVCTNKPRRLCEKALYQTGLGSFFTSVVVAGEELPSKPDPTAYKICCEELGVPSASTLLVGDSEIDRDTARAAGAQFVLVSYGYPIGTIDSIGAKFVCDSPESLFKMLQSFRFADASEVVTVQ